MTPPSDDDPRDLWAQARALDADADGLRERALRLALESSGWNLRRAAAALDTPHTSIVRLLTGRFADGLGAEYRRRNPGTGRPKNTAQ